MWAETENGGRWVLKIRQEVLSRGDIAFEGAGSWTMARARCLDTAAELDSEV
jgi:hypothetical protein